MRVREQKFGSVLNLKVLTLAILALAMQGCSATNKLPDWMAFSGNSANSESHAVAVPWETSFATARTQAEDSEKILMLWFTGSDWCKYCTMLEQEVFHTTQFNEWYGNKIVPVMLDYPRTTSLPPNLAQQNEELKDQYSKMVTSYPTALFVNTKGEVLGKLGYVRGGPENWIRQAENILAVTW